MPAWYWLAFLLLAVQVQAPERGTVEGTVIQASTGEPVPGARVRLRRDFDLRIQPDEGDLLFTTTDEQGRYKFTGVEFGSYRLRAAKPGFLEPDVPVATSTAQPHVEVQVPLRRYAVIAGKISDATGLPLADAEVRLLRRSVPRPGHPPMADSAYPMEELIRVTADDRGEYRLPRLAPDAYYVEARPGILLRGDNTYRATYYPRTPEIAAAEPINITEGQTVRADIQIIQQRGVRVAGGLINVPQSPREGRPRIYTQVYLAPREQASRYYSGPLASAVGDRFELHDVQPGQYTLMALTRSVPDAATEPRIQKPILWAHLPVVVGDSDIENVQVTLQPTFDIPGTVSFVDGCKAGPALIRLSMLGSHLAGSAETISGGDGAFVLSGMVPGKYYLDRSRRTGMPWPVRARAGDNDVLKSGLEVTSATSGPLEVTMTCAEAGANR